MLRVLDDQIHNKCKRLRTIKCQMVYIIKKWTTATVQVVYYIPDHLSLVNEFMWQTEDQIPEYPRITEFLDYWDKNIDGPIKEVFIHDHEENNIRVVDRRYKFN